MADIAVETGDEELLLAAGCGQCLQQEDVCYRRGRSSRDNEGFTDDYDLPSKDACGDLCGHRADSLRSADVACRCRCPVC